MCRVRHSIRFVLSCVTLAIFMLAAPACQSHESSSTTQTTTDGNGDPIAGSDADRASAELDSQKEEREDRGRRPGNNGSRGGTRVVDQPRVGGGRK